MQYSFAIPPVDDSSLTREIPNARREIRQESNDAYNRLHSIAEDAAFISRMAYLYPAFKMYRTRLAKMLLETSYS